MVIHTKQKAKLHTHEPKKAGSNVYTVDRDPTKKSAEHAFYHRDYQSYQAAIVEIEPDCVRIISYPGIDRSILQKTIAEGEQFKSRYYRNKRLGEFLKELDLTEGKSTGIPTIQEELRDNGSPKATLETDDERRAVTVEIPIHPDFLIEQGEPQNEPPNASSVEDAILQLIRIKVFNSIIFHKSMHYNPFAYIHLEKVILKLVTTLISNTKGEGKGGDDFWLKAETLLYTALIGFICLFITRHRKRNKTSLRYWKC